MSFLDIPTYTFEDDDEEVALLQLVNLDDQFAKEEEAERKLNGARDLVHLALHSNDIVVNKDRAISNHSYYKPLNGFGRIKTLDDHFAKGKEETERKQSGACNLVHLTLPSDAVVKKQKSISKNPYYKPLNKYTGFDFGLQESNYDPIKTSVNERFVKRRLNGVHRVDRFVQHLHAKGRNVIFTLKYLKTLFVSLGFNGKGWSERNFTISGIRRYNSQGPPILVVVRTTLNRGRQVGCEFKLHPEYFN